MNKEIIIERPPKIYLDTRDLINIAEVRKGNKPQPPESEENYCNIDKCIKSYGCLIFNPYSALEWVEGNATKESARGIAAVVDSAKVKYIIDSDYIVYTSEVLEQCQKQVSNIKLPNLPPVLQNISDNNTFRSALGILLDCVPDYLQKEKLEQIKKKGSYPATVPIFSAQQWTEETFNWKQRNKELYQERIKGFKDSLSEDIESQEEYFNNPQKYRRDWIKRFLKIDRILKALNPKIDIDSVLDKIDLRKCQAIDLCWKVREKRMKSGKPPEENDVDDYIFLSIIPYADLVLMEKQLCGYILWADSDLKSKVFSDTSDFLDVLKNQGFTW